MTGLGYFAKCVRGLNIDEMKNTAKYIAEKTKKNYILILIDMIYCGARFKAGYNDYREFELYLLSNKKRATYLTRCLNNRIIKTYNDKDQRKIFDNKINFYEAYGEFLGRDWLNLNTSDFEEFKHFAQKYQSFIVKPSGGQCGIGVEKISVNDKTDFEQLYKTIIDKGQDIAEELIEQNEEIAKLNPESVNTLRMFTFCSEKGSIVLQTILKIGNNGYVDNFYSGGMYTFVDNDGVVHIPAIDKQDRIYYVHPKTGEKIVGFRVPMLEEAKEMVKKASMVNNNVGYVGWDVAITKKGPIIVEGNAYPGIFQPRASFSSDGNGILPVYRQYMNI